MTSEEHHVVVLPGIHTDEEIEVHPNGDNKKEENLKEIALNIDQIIQCQGSSSSSSSIDKTLEAKHNHSSCSTVKVVQEEEEVERVCRICQLSQEPSPPEVSLELIQLGCVCKGELGLAHTVCAEAWFRLKGNRFCEICGETATNISGVWDDRLMEKLWPESGSNFGSSPREEGRCWRGQPFCNFLMGCLVIAFVLPWFFRGNMF